MLRKVQPATARRVGGRYAIIASKYNAEYVDSMLRAAEAVLAAARARAVEVVRVPGAFEMPAVAARLARRAKPRLSALICLGVILRGETVHAQLIGEAVTEALARLQVECEIPIIHEVLLLENRAQAEKRCLDRRHNRGTEAAQTAVAMAELMAGLGGARRNG